MHTISLNLHSILAMHILKISVILILKGVRYFFKERETGREKGGRRKGGRKKEEERVEEDGGERRQKAYLIPKCLKFGEPALFISLLSVPPAPPN